MVLEALIYAIEAGEGIVKVVGEVGSGKTMLCRMLEQRLPKSIEIVYIANPSFSKDQIIYAIAYELKLDASENTPKIHLMQKLQDYLLEKHASGGSVLVIIEEAQSMPLETLEELRLFVNLETHQAKLVQLLLFGQPELDENLSHNSIRQLKERITHSFYLKPLTKDETEEYIKYRLTLAGCPNSNIFSRRAIKLIAEGSNGLTRRINIIADKAMLASFAESSHRLMPSLVRGKPIACVDARHVKSALRESGYRTNLLYNLLIFIVSIMLLLTLGQLAFLLANNSNNSVLTYLLDHPVNPLVGLIEDMYE